MDWFLYDNGLRHERVKLKFEQVSYKKILQFAAHNNSFFDLSLRSKSGIERLLSLV